MTPPQPATTPTTPLLPFLLPLLLFATTSTMAASRPHIVMIVADDLGWNDVGWQDPDMATPTLNRLMSEGVELTSAYMQPMCTPSRAAFLSGKYPFKIGMQNGVLSAMDNASLPLELNLLPERLHDLGYSTHLVGKWHLGFCKWAMTPTYRGFDSFYGMYLGKGGHYDHRAKNGYDMHHDGAVQWEDEGVYSSHLFTQRAIEVVENHDAAQDPLFLLLSYQAVHGPLEVPQSYVDNFCSHVNDSNRRLHCALTAAMDEGIGNLTAALTSHGYDDNLLIFFTTDNGGPPSLGSSNWPLRGGKGGLWEGGTRAVSFLHSPGKALLPDSPYKWDGLVHAVDWFPTLLEVAGDNSSATDIDGINLWNRIRGNRKSSRTEMVYNIDEVEDNAAIRRGKFKLVVNKPGNLVGWYNPPAGETAPPEPTGSFQGYQLFDLDADPAETTDVQDKNSNTRRVTTELLARLVELEDDLVPQQARPSLDASDPSNFQGAWFPGWC